MRIIIDGIKTLLKWRNKCVNLSSLLAYKDKLDKLHGTVNIKYSLESHVAWFYTYMYIYINFKISKFKRLRTLLTKDDFIFNN